MYAANDSYFAPSVAAALHGAFVAGGGKADLEQTGPYDGDGHRLFFEPEGAAVWGPMVERYLDPAAWAPAAWAGLTRHLAFLAPHA